MKFDRQPPDQTPQQGISGSIPSPDLNRTASRHEKHCDIQSSSSLLIFDYPLQQKKSEQLCFRLFYFLHSTQTPRDTKTTATKGENKAKIHNTFSCSTLPALQRSEPLQPSISTPSLFSRASTGGTDGTSSFQALQLCPAQHS